MDNAVVAQLVDRRLSTRDKQLRGQVQGAAGDPAEELTLSNLHALSRAIESAKTPQERAVLLQELNRLRGMAQNLVGPLRRQPLPGDPSSSVMLLPYDPATQRPGIAGGQPLPAPAAGSPWQRIDPRQYPSPSPALPWPPPGGVRG